MGRKLHNFEVKGFGLGSDSSAAGEASNQADSHKEIQLRIAEALGISVEELIRAGDLPGLGQKSAGSSDTASAALNRDCSAMLQAFACIEDPGERQRLIEIVQNAATKSSSGDLE